MPRLESVTQFYSLVQFYALPLQLHPSLLLSYHGGDNVEAHNHNRHNEDIQYIYHPIRSRMIILPIITLLNFTH